MGSIPRVDTVLAYRCATCKKVWAPQTLMVKMACAVMHYPGDCCHYGEHEVEVVPKGERREAAVGDE